MHGFETARGGRWRQLAAAASGVTPGARLCRLAPRFRGLWANPDFRRLWASLTITQFGGQVTLLALPLTAALLLDATPMQMGVLTALGALPFGLFGLFTGVLVDRSRKLPLIIAADLGRAAALVTIPLAALFGALSMSLLYLVEFLVGAGGMVGWASYQVFMTERVGRENLIDANAKIALSESTAQLIGPGIAGLAIQWLTAPVAILLDALSFSFSAWMLRGIPARPADHPGPRSGQSLWREIGDGLRAIWQSEWLRSLAWSVGWWNLLRHMYLAVIVLYATRVLNLSAGAIGAAWMGGGLGCIAASLVARRVNRRYGMGAVMVGGLFLTGLAWGLIGFIRAGAVQSDVWTTLALGSGMFAFDLGGTLFFINYLTLRQAVTPDRLLGRVVSTMIFLTVVSAPLGSLAGGALGDWLGLRAAIWAVAAGGIALGLVLVRISPLPRLRSLPQV